MATKSEQGPKLNRRAWLEGSSSEFSEDDTPLAMRLNSQENRQPKDCGKQFRQSVMAKKGKFVIPRKKKAANGGCYGRDLRHSHNMIKRLLLSTAKYPHISQLFW